jgi:hypothetical protein
LPCEGLKVVFEYYPCVVIQPTFSPLSPLHSLINNIRESVLMYWCSECSKFDCLVKSVCVPVRQDRCYDCEEYAKLIKMLKAKSQPEHKEVSYEQDNRMETL